MAGLTKDLFNRSRLVTYWLFQGNPKYYSLLEAIQYFEQMPWLMTGYAQGMATGDGVILWTGDKAGNYAMQKFLNSLNF